MDTSSAARSAPPCNPTRTASLEGGLGVEDERQACRDAGMDGQLAKPVRPAELTAALEATRCPSARSRDAFCGRTS
jgi:CheY-like chemotaxis protein